MVPIGQMHSGATLRFEISAVMSGKSSRRTTIGILGAFCALRRRPHALTGLKPLRPVDVGFFV
jgi:hypothetical protein